MRTGKDSQGMARTRTKKRKEEEREEDKKENDKAKMANNHCELVIRHLKQ